MSNEPKEDPVVELGRQIRREREAQGMTLEQLSEHSGITPNYIGTIENGKKDPGLSTLTRIANGLGVPLGELLGAKPRLTSSVMELARLFDQVVVEVQTAVLLVVRTYAARRRR